MPERMLSSRSESTTIRTYPRWASAAPPAVDLFGPPLQQPGASAPRCEKCRQAEAINYMRRLFEIFPDNPDAICVSNLRASLERLLGSSSLRDVERLLSDREQASIIP